MKERFVIDSATLLRAISQQTRLEIIRHLIEGPLTAEELAQAIGQAKSKLYYHLGELEKFELIEVVETHQKNNLIEKVYRATASYYAVERGLFSQSHDREIFEQSVTSILDTTAADISKLLQSLAAEDDPGALIYHSHRKIKMSPERLEVLNERLHELMIEFEDEEAETASILTFVLYRHKH